MSVSGGRSSSSSLVVLLILIISVLHIWAFGENRVAAVRVFPERRVAPEEENHRTMKSNVNHTEIFRAYFKKRVSDLNSSAGLGSSRQINGTFQDSKRRVPSCPDPLHNK